MSCKVLECDSCLLSIQAQWLDRAALGITLLLPDEDCKERAARIRTLHLRLQAREAAMLLHAQSSSPEDLGCLERESL